MTAGIEIISASAGSGKTTRLTEELEKAIENGMRPEGVLATTFTRKAASELIARVRLNLLKKNFQEAAHGVFDGYVGTVNSVCGRLLRDFAFEAGLSPTQEIIPETEEANVFKTAADPVLDEYAPLLEPLAHRLGQPDWADDVRKLIAQARANAIDPAAMTHCAEKSWQGLKKVLPEPLPPDQADPLDWQLHQAVKRALAALKSGGDGTKKTQDAIDVLAAAQAKIRGGGRLTWQDWARLSKLAPAKASRETVAPVNQAASVHPAHPGLCRDLEQFIRKMFDCAAAAMTAFADYKRREGLIDYVDQEFLTYSTPYFKVRIFANGKNMGGGNDQQQNHVKRPDLVIVNRARQLHAEKLISFDRKFQKKFPGYVVESLEAI